MEHELLGRARDDSLALNTYECVDIKQWCILQHVANNLHAGIHDYMLDAPDALQAHCYSWLLQYAHFN